MFPSFIKIVICREKRVVDFKLKVMQCNVLVTLNAIIYTMDKFDSPITSLRCFSADGGLQLFQTI